MKKILSEDSARRAFERIDEEDCKKWQQKHLRYCYEPLLVEEWILDVDATVKPLYVHQEGQKFATILPNQGALPMLFTLILWQKQDLF